MGHNNTDELFSVVEDNTLYQVTLIKKIGYETFSVFETVGFVTRWDRQVGRKVVWKDYSRRIKSFTFHSYNQQINKLTMKEILQIVKKHIES